MSKVLFQITEEDIRSFVESEHLLLPEEDIAEIVEVISTLDVEDILLDIFIQYSQNQIRCDMEKCLACDKLNDCELGKYILAHGPKLAGMKPITISGVN